MMADRVCLRGEQSPALSPWAEQTGRARAWGALPSSKSFTKWRDRETPCSQLHGRGALGKQQSCLRERTLEHGPHQRRERGVVSSTSGGHSAGGLGRLWKSTAVLSTNAVLGYYYRSYSLSRKNPGHFPIHLNISPLILSSKTCEMLLSNIEFITVINIWWCQLRLL